MGVITLYRPVGPKELALIEASGWSEFPPRLPDQPIFYPVLERLGAPSRWNTLRALRVLNWWERR